MRCWDFNMIETILPQRFVMNSCFHSSTNINLEKSLKGNVKTKYLFMINNHLFMKWLYLYFLIYLALKVRIYHVLDFSWKRYPYAHLDTLTFRFRYISYCIRIFTYPDKFLSCYFPLDIYPAALCNLLCLRS